MTTRISRDAYGLKLAEAAALRADCTRRQVGAVIVAPDGSIVATGYNGLSAGKPGCLSAGACPRGQMAYPTEPPVKVGGPDPTEGPWFGSAQCWKRWQRNGDGELATCTAKDGHNGWHIAGNGEEVWAVLPPDGVQPASLDYEATGCRAVHAEVNAIIRAGRDRCVGATIYVTAAPCFHCSVVIEGAGLARVVTPETDLRPFMEAIERAVRDMAAAGLGFRSESPSDLEAPSFPAVPRRRGAVAPGDDAWLIPNVHSKED